MGDLSENAEYKSARERQEYVRARVRQLQEQLAKLSSIDIGKLPHDRASYGSTLILRDIDRGSEVTYRLVTPEEADFEQGLISTSSPIAKVSSTKRREMRSRCRTRKELVRSRLSNFSQSMIMLKAQFDGATLPVPIRIGGFGICPPDLI